MPDYVFKKVNTVPTSGLAPGTIYFEKSTNTIKVATGATTVETFGAGDSDPGVEDLYYVPTATVYPGHKYTIYPSGDAAKVTLAVKDARSENGKEIIIVAPNFKDLNFTSSYEIVKNEHYDNVTIEPRDEDGGVNNYGQIIYTILFVYNPDDGYVFYINRAKYYNNTIQGGVSGIAKYSTDAEALKASLANPNYLVISVPEGGGSN